MRIERIEIVACGPFRDRQRELAPGMTVLFGPNEAGKSTWHMAIYLAVCGLPRGRGRPTKEVERLAELHKPWDSDLWEVRATLQLADGRRVELHQDLAGRVDCSAIDLTTGRDISNEIVDGTLDASRWLGLDRRSFLATACVRQADLLSILEDPRSLQVYLQRAAATRGTDATAAAAIQRLERFKSDHVGLDRANSTKPLRRARTEVDAATTALRQAEEAHARFLDDSVRAERAADRAGELEAELKATKALLAERELKAARTKLHRIHELRSRLGDEPPPNPTALLRTIAEARSALQAWKGRPNPVDVRGETAAELEERLRTLPPMPDGDLAVDARVASAWHAFELARDALARQPPTPPPPPPPKTGGLDEAELNEAIRQLEQPEPAAPVDAERRVEMARKRIQEASRAGSLVALVVGAGVLTATGTILTVIGASVPGLISLVGGTAAIIVAFALRGRRPTEALKKLHAAETELGEQRFALDRIRKEKETVRARLTAAGLPHEPAALRELLERLKQTEREATAYAVRAAEMKRLREELAAAQHELADALAARGVDLDRQQAEAAYHAYAQTCERNAAIAVEARKREPLEAQLRQRRALERTAAEVEQQRREARDALRSAAEARGLAAPDDESLADALTSWIEQSEADLSPFEEAMKGWSELDALLDARTVEDIEADVRRLEEQWETLRAEVDEARLIAIQDTKGDLRERVDRLTREASAARSEADTLSGRVQQMAAELPSVAEAEERLAVAERELERIQRLETTLSLTLGFLQNAQARAHRDIAPVLADAIRSWLPTITDGRYVDAAVDPATLTVRVRTADGAWRDARRLSQGTREQIYLLLRVALAEQLTARGEVCPLILDDVTVQCDTVRTQRILELLHEASRERQVILFTQEDAVLRWAETELDSEQDALILLGQSD